jgi:hypothetical protein
MTHSRSLLPAALTTAFGLSLSLNSAAIAQEDPFGAAAAKPADPGAPAAAAKAGSGDKAAAPVDATKREPLPIEMLRSNNPATPRDVLQAARAAFQYGRADESKRFLAKLLTDKPADDALAPLTSRFADFLFQLASTKDLQPEGQQAAELIWAAAERSKLNPDQITAAIALLSDANPGARQQALDRLAAAGTSIVNPMLQVLADSSREKEHPNIRSALVSLGGSTELPLLGALESTNISLKMQTISVLARIGSRRAAVHLIRPALDPAASTELRQLAAAALVRITGAKPDLYEAERYLRRELNHLLCGELPYERDANDQVPLWQWDETQQAVAPVILPRYDAGVMLAARVAADLVALKPEDISVQHLKVLTSLELAKVLTGLDQPLPTTPGTAGAAALQAGSQVVSQVLAAALRDQHIPAAIAAAEVLGQCSDAAVLHAASGVSPLAEAMLSSDRRVRLAAALAAVKLAPGDSFAGASRVSETLGWFAGTSGQSVVLVGHPRGEDAQSLVGFANALGYEGEGVSTGRDLAQRAFANPDYEFILVSDAIDSPPVAELVQWLRRDFRTARLPIGVMARGERLDSVRDALSNDPFTTVFPLIHSVEVMTVEVNKLKTIAGRNLVGRDERLAQAHAALRALTILAANPQNLARYDLLRQEPTLIGALNHPALLVDAAAVLSLFGTPQAQTALLDLASQSSRPLADRQAAATALVAAVKSRGLLLTQSQIGQQYARYNASAHLDKPTQVILGSLLDTLEGPALARGELGSRQ